MLNHTKVDNKIVEPNEEGNYVATVYDKGLDVQNVLVEVVANEPHAKIQIGDGTEWYTAVGRSTVTFRDGTRTITLNINIQPQDENSERLTKELTINLVSDDVTIKSVKNGDKIVTEYDSSTHTFYEYLDRDVTEVGLVIEANSNYTTLRSGEIEGTGIIAINNIAVQDAEEMTVTFKAIAETGREQEYTVKLLRKSDNANAAHIYVDGVDIIDRFEDIESVPTAVISTSRNKNSTHIRVIPENSYASIKIGDFDAHVGDTQENVALDVDLGTITVPIVITSQDGKVVKTYNIMFVRLSNDTKIQWLEVNGKHVIEDEEGNYEVTLAASEKNANVKITLSNVLAKVTMGGEEKQGYLEENVILPETGDTVKTITVTAVDGTVRTCTLTIHKQVNDLGLEKVYLDNRIATKINDTTFEIDVKKGTTLADIRAIASNSEEYVSISGNSNMKGENTYTDCSIEDKIVKIKVTAMFEGEVDQEKEYSLIINEVEEPDVLEDLKVTIKVDDEEILPNEDGDYVKVVDSSKDNAALWAGVTSETSKVKIADRNGETEYENPSSQKNISLQDATTEVTVTVQNGALEEKEYKVYIVKDVQELDLKSVFVDNRQATRIDDTNYQIDIVKGTTNVDIKAVLYEDTEYVSIAGNEATIAENTYMGYEIANGYVIKIVASNGVDKTAENYIEKEYTLTLKEVENVEDLSDLQLTIKVDNKEAEKQEDGIYIAKVEEDKSNALVEAISTSSTTKVKIGDTEFSVREARRRVDLPDNVTKVEITAQNGAGDEVTYKLYIVKQDTPEESDASLKELRVDSELVEPNEDGTYDIELKANQIKPNLEAIATQELAFVSIDGNVPTRGTNSKEIDMTNETEKEITITVTAIDGTEKQYTVRIHKLSAITGKVITQAVDQEKQTAKIIIYKTADTRDENDIEDPREVIQEIMINPDGTYTVDLKPDEYDMVIKKTSYLEYRLTNIVVEDGETVTIEDINIYAGDVVKSGQIEIDDLVTIVDNYGTVQEEAQKIYDLNEDGVIDSKDRVLIKENYDKMDVVEVWVNPDAVSTMSVKDVENQGQNGVLSGDNTLSSGSTAERSTQTPNEKGFIKPLDGNYTITSEYGTRMHPVTGVVKKHTGIDLGGEHHANVYAVYDGEVTFAGVQNGFGNCIEIKHTLSDGTVVYSFYAHLSKIDVEVGDKISIGEKIGNEGGDPETDPNPGSSTGHHLHFEIRNASGYGNDIDPETYIDL